MARRTVCALWRHAVTTAPSSPAFLVEEGDAWRPVGWREAGRRVDELAAGFLSLGVGPGDRVAILCRTRLEWTLVDYALIAIGAVVVPLYPTASPAEWTHVLAHSAARMVVVEGAAERDRVERLPGLRALERAVAIEDGELDGLAERGRDLLRRDPQAVARAGARVGADDLLTLVYTSGTTGPPKGCLLTHRNYRAMAEIAHRVPGLLVAGDVAVLHLPLAHVFARLVQFLGPEAQLTIAHCPDVSGLAAALRGVRPTLLPSVPRLFEAMRAAVTAGIERETGSRRRLAGWALAVGRRAALLRREGRRLGPSLAFQLALADRLVLSPVRARFGGRLRLAVSGGARLAPEVVDFFDALGLPVLDGYGLTEATTVVAVNPPGRHRPGTVGPPMAGVEVRIAPDGEILVRAETVFAGYLDDAPATTAALGAGGWLHTGDVGVLDADGYLAVTDRKRDIIVTPGGENVSPQNVEDALRASRYIAEALVVGEGRPYLVALLALEQHAARAAGTPEAVRDLVGRTVADVNRGLGLAERVRRFAILPRDFLPERGEVTPTLKLRRRVCEEHFRDVIESLYAGAGRPVPGSAPGRCPG